MIDSNKDRSHVSDYFAETAAICKSINKRKIDDLVHALIELRIREGRLFFLGLGGSAANCSHMVNDFRKIGHMECYSISDNIAELTARANDDGFDTIYSEWLKTSKLSGNDAIFVCSVSGGGPQNSLPLVKAIDYAKTIGAKIYGVCGKSQGYLNTEGDIVILVPNICSRRVTAHSEGFQMIISHCIVNHPHFQQI